jgi:hypothetical protein
VGVGVVVAEVEVEDGDGIGRAEVCGAGDVLGPCIADAIQDSTCWERRASKLGNVREGSSRWQIQHSSSSGI